MPLTVRRGSGGVEYALVSQFDALRRMVAAAQGQFHLEVSSMGGGDFTTPTLFPLTFVAPPATDLPSLLALRSGGRELATRHRLHTRDAYAHLVADAATISPAGAPAGARRRDRVRQRREGQVQRAPVAGPACTPSTIGTRSPPPPRADLQTSCDLANTYRALFNTHIQASPAGALHRAAGALMSFNPKSSASPPGATPTRPRDARVDVHSAPGRFKRYVFPPGKEVQVPSEYDRAIHDVREGVIVGGLAPLLERAVPDGALHPALDPEEAARKTAVEEAERAICSGEGRRRGACADARAQEVVVTDASSDDGASASGGSCTTCSLIRSWSCGPERVRGCTTGRDAGWDERGKEAARTGWGWLPEGPRALPTRAASRARSVATPAGCSRASAPPKTLHYPPAM